MNENLTLLIDACSILLSVNFHLKVDKTCKHYLQMFLSKVVIISILLKSVTSTCVDHHKGPCKRTDQCEPLVTPINSTHLLVNWEKAFHEDCEESYIEEIVIIVQRDGITKRKKVSSDRKETSVEADPCFSYSIRVVMKLKPSYSSSQKSSSLKSPSTTNFVPDRKIELWRAPSTSTGTNQTFKNLR